MKTSRRLGLAGLLLAVALVIASCGGNAGGSGGGSAEGQGEDMQGMDHGGSGSGTVPEETTGGGMAGMDHGGMGSGDMAQMSREMVMPGGEYSDAAFVDSMVPHHQGAVDMARVALKNAEHDEIKQLSRDIIDSQQAEIEEFNGLRGGLEGPGTRTSEEEMNSMMGMPDPQELARQRPFDRAFIDAMVPHHESAIEMAEVALEDSQNPDIRSIAENIVSSQEREIRQMEQWRQEWSPES